MALDAGSAVASQKILVVNFAHHNKVAMVNELRAQSTYRFSSLASRTGLKTTTNPHIRLYIITVNT
jgi:hypothetical protein